MITDPAFFPLSTRHDLNSSFAILPTGFQKTSCRYAGRYSFRRTYNRFAAIANFRTSRACRR
ncbi:hypothetical protein KCP75_01965 [Salmonella enterica subsp. enterica]|nr:hypothetical protein KCP75_01965 [Salmonella enterica subsp. enterica]